MNVTKTKYQQEYIGFCDDLKRHPQVAGLVLAGSRARGLESSDSDTDVYIIMDDRCSRKDIQSARSQFHAEYGQPLRLDLTHQALQTVSDFEAFEVYQGCSGYSRYAVVHAKLEFDKTDGRISQLLRSKQQLDSSEKEIGIERYFPAYLNKVYRSLLSWQREECFAAKLYAATSIDFLVGSLFAFHGRVPPYSKYLEWELTQFPLETIPTEVLLGSLNQIISTASVSDQRRLFKRLVKMAMDQGHEKYVAAWHGKLDFILQRPP